MANNLVRWGAFDDLTSLWDSLDRLQERIVPRPGTSRAASMRLPVDVYETDHDIVVTTVLPGVDPADVDVTLERGVLTLRGEIKPPLGNVNYWVQEIPYGTFARSLTLNIPLQEDEITASFDKGILTVCLPKAAAARSRTIKVDVKRD